MYKFLKFLPVVIILIFVACGGPAGGGEIPPPRVQAPPPPVPPPPPVAPPPAAADVASEPGDVDGDVFTMSFALAVQDGHSRTITARRFAEMVYERSGGRLVVNVFPGGQLGSDPDVVEAVMRGDIEFSSLITSNIAGSIPEFALFDLPYLFVSDEQALGALSGTLGEAMGEIMEEQNLVYFGFWLDGFKHLTNNVRPIHSVEDLYGLRIRVSQSPFLIAQFQAINAGGISVPFGELPSALRDGAADGQENPLPTIVAARLHEVQTYLTVSYHGFSSSPVFMSADAYYSLPEDLRIIIREAIEELTPMQWAMIAEEDVESLEIIYEYGVNVNYFDAAAMQGFRAAMQVVYDQFVEEIPRGADLIEVLEQYTR